MCRLMMFVLLGVIVTVPFFLSEWNGVTLRKAWDQTKQTSVLPPWRRQVDRVCYATIAVVGLAMLVAFSTSPLDLLDWVILLMFCWIGLSLLWATDRRQACGPTGCMLATGCALFGVGLTCSLHECMIVVATGAAFYLAVGVIHEGFGARPQLPAYRFWGLIGCNHQAAEAVLLLFSLCYFYQTGAIGLAVTVPLGVCALTLLMLTRTRTVIYAAATGLLAWALASLPGWKEALVVVSCASIAILLFALIPVVRSRAWSLLSFGRSQRELKTLNGRTILWAFLWPNVRRHPICGSGYGSIWNEAHQVALHQLHPFGSRLRHAHCAYLDFLVNVGVIGLLLLVASLMIAGSTAWFMAPPTGPLLVGLITYAAVHGVGESALGLSQHRTFAFYAILIAMPA